MSNRDKLTSPPPTDSAAALEQARAARRKLATTTAELQALLRLAEDRAATAEAQLNAALALSEDATPRPIRAVKRESKGKPEATYVMELSDAHFGERVRPNMVGGTNEYSPEIARERFDKYIRNNLKVLNVLRSTWDVKQLVWWWGGDLVTGYIHDELVMENYLSPTEELFMAYELLLGAVNFILDEYDVERVLIPTSSGNHGRATAKKQTSDFRTSYEFLLYRMLAKAFESEKRVEVQLGYGYENHVDVYGYRIAFHHGDEVKGGIGVGGVAPSLYRRIQRVGAGAFARDLDVYGHHHQLSFAPAAFGNGSLIGYNAYAAAIGCRPEPPQQGSFLIDAKYRVPVSMHPIFVR